MTDRHVRDEEIQTFLDGTAADAEVIEGHLETCPQCRDAVETYRRLYAGLAAAEPAVLSADFADRVMARLPEPAAAGFRAQIKRALAGEGIFAVAAFAALAAAAIIFIKPSLWTDLFHGMFKSSGPTNQQMAKTAEGVLASLKISPELLMAVVLTIIAVGLIDWIITRRRTHHTAVHLA
jgi:predicted anti-sigma-YlaC factor YlaD